MRPDQGFFFDPRLPAALCKQMLLTLQAPHRRVCRVEAAGRAVWLKQAERLNLRWRLQKGDPQRSLVAEWRGLRDLGNRGLPVARLVAAGPGFLATDEAGVSVADLLATTATREESRESMLMSAGQALAALHAEGVAHGRPALRDICWDGARARFIDLEQYRPGPAAPGRMARDLLVLLHSVLVERGRPGPETAAVLAGWQAGARQGLWDEVRRQASRLRLLRGVAKLAVRPQRPVPEVAAALVLLDWLPEVNDPVP